MNIVNIHNCYGCGVCSIVCSKKIIHIALNKDGFYEPYINELDKCTDCGLCVEVCSFSHKSLSLKKKYIRSYAAWSNDTFVHKESSSGGIGFEIGCTLIAQGYKVCGVRYNIKENHAEHYIANTIKELKQSMGSKYIQSYTVDGFKAINRKEEYLVTGTPCQIDSFRRYIQKFNVEDNFVLMDFFCHSVPSMFVWKKYLKMIEKKINNIKYVSWRNKFTGWHDSYSMFIVGENMEIYNSRLSRGDIFYKLFLGDYNCNPACQKNCKYKYDKSSADIRVGDFWGKTYQSNEEGVSALISFTQKGQNVIDSIKNCTLIEYPFDIVAEGQMKTNVRCAYTGNLVKYMLKNEIQFSPFLWKIIFKIEGLLKKIKAVSKILCK